MLQKVLVFAIMLNASFAGLAYYNGTSFSASGIHYELSGGGQEWVTKDVDVDVENITMEGVYRSVYGSAYHTLPVNELSISFSKCKKLITFAAVSTEWRWDGTNVTSTFYGLRNITCAAFKDCELLETIRLPSKLLRVPSELCRNCPKLRSVEMYVEEVSPYMFAECVSLAEINIPSSCESIGEGAFLNCSSLKYITLPKKLNSIGHRAFSGAPISTIVANCSPPLGLKESRILDSYPNVIFPTQYRETWNRALEELADKEFVIEAKNEMSCVAKFVKIAQPVINPIDETLFEGSSLSISITCETPDVKIYYSLDGTRPNKENGRVYNGDVKIYDTSTIKAIAIKDGCLDSDETSAKFTKVNQLSSAANLYAYLPDNDANAPWIVDTEVSHDGKKSVRSGAVTDNGSTAMKVTVRGSGKISFWWKAGCEESTDGEYYDYGCFRIGTEEPSAYIAGNTEWQRVVVDIPTPGKHVLIWEYHKDDAETIPPDCIWVDQVQWMPDDDSGVTLLSEIPVKYSWLYGYNLGLEADFEIAAEETAANGHKVWECYVAGEDPTDATSRFAAKITVGEDGKPSISWNPDLGEERVYKILGSTDLKTWEVVSEGHEADYSFFKVTVEMK